MSVIDNYIAKILSDKGNCFSDILVYLDYKKVLTPEYVIDYVNQMINNNPVLKQEIVNKDNDCYFRTIPDFDVNNYITILSMDKDTFDDAICQILHNTKLPDSFYVVYCYDETNNVSRFYFKINHAYTDGYRLINILTKPLFREESIPVFKRKTTIFKTIYHCIIGTFILIWMNMKMLFNLLLNTKNNYVMTNRMNTKIDFIKCKSFSLNKIKKVASNNGITVNDFLYSLMIKTDRLYTKKNRIVQTCSPINVTKLSHINNMYPILCTMNNSLDDKTLFQKTHNLFDHFKYSLFIPIMSFFLNNFLPFINISIIAFLYHAITNECDYLFTNIIGPSVEELNSLSGIDMTDIHFLVKSESKLIFFNTISTDDNINIICSFKEGRIKDKKRFEECIYDAFESLMDEECDDLA